MDLDLNHCQAQLEERIGYHFGDRALLAAALTHKSYSNEQLHAAVPFNERLEFLGDAVLDLVVSEELFRMLPQAPEGELTRIRAEVVREKGLAEVAVGLDLGACLNLGRGEERSGGRDKESLLADALEALLGAVFCDGGFPAARQVAGGLFRPLLLASARRKVGVDHKTRLQEVIQARHGRPPSYALAQTEGPDHRRVYTAIVSFEGVTLGQGRGTNKKGAEQEAARHALAKLGA